MDIKKRRKYDSTLEFDESIPEEPIDSQTFFDSFNSTFQKNSFWSNKQPVPIFGSMETPFTKVAKFYKFW